MAMCNTIPVAGEEMPDNQEWQETYNNKGQRAAFTINNSTVDVTVANVNLVLYLVAASTMIASTGRVKYDTILVHAMRSVLQCVCVCVCVCATMDIRCYTVRYTMVCGSRHDVPIADTRDNQGPRSVRNI
eukprot:5327006-Amphidinium_carterae.1